MTNRDTPRRTVLTGAAALGVATWMLGGIWFEHDGLTAGNVIRFLVVAAILGTISSFVAPVLKLLSLPFVIVTLGLFLWVINAWMLMLTGWFADKFDLGFHVDGFWSALWGALIITIVNWGLSLVMENDE